MPNIILDRAVFPELIQENASPRRIAEWMLRLIPDSPDREEMLRNLAEARSVLGGPGALDKAAQYVIDLSWREDELRQILAERVRGYCARHEISLDPVARQRNYNGDRKALREVFTDPWRSPRDVKRGSAGYPPHVWIHELAYDRPRWAAHLCKLSARVATSQSASKITWEHASSVLDDFGEERVKDLVREHRHECPNVADLIQAFVDQPAALTTAALMVTITNRILQHVKPTIDGELVASPLLVAHFLFRIGFLIAVFNANTSDEVRHVFESRPNLLQSGTNPDEGAQWEVHHCFRKHLRINDSDSAT
jgi:hypothetical protein